jgi:hypothetical protein
MEMAKGLKGEKRMLPRSLDVLLKTPLKKGILVGITKN